LQTPCHKHSADRFPQNYQQPLDITVNHGEKVFFVVTGSHTVYLTGNYIMDDDEEDSDEDDDDYDLSPDELDYAMGEGMSDDESDELDGLEDPRVTEVDSEDEAPKLVEAKKGKNKRAAEDAEALDDLIAKDDSKLSKKQQKKLKNNKGEPVAAEEDAKKSDKKVQFAKNLEQGPTGSTQKGSVGVKVVQGVTVDDRTIGKGRTVKNGDTVGVRYIGKLQNGNQFDCKFTSRCRYSRAHN
jgi:FK506-binding nuclear protein